MTTNVELEGALRVAGAGVAAVALGYAGGSIAAGVDPSEFLLLFSAVCGMVVALYTID